MNVLGIQYWKNVKRNVYVFGIHKQKNVKINVVGIHNSKIMNMYVREYSIEKCEDESGKNTVFKNVMMNVAGIHYT